MKQPLAVLIVLLYCLPAALSAQPRPKGTYSYSTGFTADEINFQDDNRVEFAQSSCTGNAQGSGTYEIKDGNLVLRFQSGPKKQPDSIRLSEYKDDTDSVTMMVSLFDRATLEPLISGSAFFQDAQGNVIGGLATDMEGKGTIKLLPSNDTIFLDVRYIGYKNFQYPIVPDRSYKIAVHLNDSWTYQYETGDSIVYKIRNIRKNSIEIKKDYSYSRFQTYTKK